MKLDIPGRGSYEIEHLVLDMNGTIATDGELIDGVAERVSRLADLVHIVVLTADTHGGASRLAEELNIETVVLDRGGEAEQKAEHVRRMGADRTIAIGNGANDAIMLRESAVGICVIGREGASAAALAAADVITTNIRDALDLLLNPRRLVATLRT
jgi:P-type E1-E2 ATPase